MYHVYLIRRIFLLFKKQELIGPMKYRKALEIKRAAMRNKKVITVHLLRSLTGMGPGETAQRIKSDMENAYRYRKDFDPISHCEEISTHNDCCDFGKTLADYASR